MRRQINLTTRRDLTAAIRQRYQVADRNGKKLIPDEFVKLTSYHRKHAIRLLTMKGRTYQGRQIGHRTYVEAVKEALIVLWEASDRIWQTAEVSVAIVDRCHGAAWASAFAGWREGTAFGHKCCYHRSAASAS